MAKKKKVLDSDTQIIPSGDFKFWLGQYVLSALVLQFYIKKKRFPISFRRSSLRVRGRNISVEMK